MAMRNGRLRIPGVVISLSIASAAAAGADKLSSDRAATNGVEASTAAVLRGAAEGDSRRGAIEKAARPRALPGDPEFGIERFPAFDEKIDSPPVPREPKTKWIEILTELTFLRSTERAFDPTFSRGVCVHRKISLRAPKDTVPTER